ncbi:MFRP [Branchiostoma lanceolatum]|uniref:MFRP protein n=1 Tax=Branchiostoma lanceolatum TaxID=7740 RepID=A0A8J9ZEV6_BRALA|nr:MFRP [Branchiostoma lanceolatum]
MAELNQFEDLAEEGEEEEEPRQCPELTAPSNGALNPPGATSYPTRVTSTCNSGYSLNGAVNARCQADGSWSNPVPTCTDIDECRVDAPCDVNAGCTNTDGSYLCQCNIGYEGSGLECTDIDECSSGAPCDSNAECSNTDGSFLCQCNRGHLGNGFNCIAVERHTLAFLLTNPRWNAVFSNPQLREELTNLITNTLGEITSEIQESIDGISVLALKPGSVIAVSELSLTTDAIPKAESLITNSTRDGSFGSEPVDPTSVVFGPDALKAGENECQTGTHNCDPNAICSDKYVGFKCSCRQGFTGDGLQCTSLFTADTELVEEQGDFTSPSYPNPYPGNLRHKWTIRAPDPTKVIKLEFTEFHLEGALYRVCRYDNLSVYDGETTTEDNSLGTFCGSELPEPLTSTGSVMTLIFLTDEQQSFPGFKITYQQTDKVVLDFKLGQFACENAQGYIVGWKRCNEQSDCRDSSDEQKCQCQQLSNLDLGICKVLDYSDVLLPNWVGHETLQEIKDSAEMQSLTQYIQDNTACHAQFIDYVCSILFPKCDRRNTDTYKKEIILYEEAAKKSHKTSAFKEADTRYKSPMASEACTTCPTVPKVLFDENSNETRDDVSGVGFEENSHETHEDVREVVFEEDSHETPHEKYPRAQIVLSSILPRDDPVLQRVGENVNASLKVISEGTRKEKLSRLPETRATIQFFRDHRCTCCTKNHSTPRTTTKPIGTDATTSHGARTSHSSSSTAFPAETAFRTLGKPPSPVQPPSGTVGIPASERSSTRPGTFADELYPLALASCHDVAANGC